MLVEIIVWIMIIRDDVDISFLPSGMQGGRKLAFGFRTISHGGVQGCLWMEIVAFIIEIRINKFYPHTKHILAIYIYCYYDGYDNNKLRY